MGMMEAAVSSEMSFHFYQTSQYHIPEGSNSLYVRWIWCSYWGV